MDAISTAQAVEKLGTIGLLALATVIEAGIIVYLAKLYLVAKKCIEQEKDARRDDVKQLQSVTIDVLKTQTEVISNTKDTLNRIANRLDSGGLR